MTHSDNADPAAAENSNAEAVSRRSWPRRMLNRLEVGQAVFFAIVLRVWQLFGGAVTLVLMTTYFTLETQGVYYVFASLIALQSFFELGFNIVIVNLCSHEWASLRLSPSGLIEGDSQALSRLVSLGRLLFRWYGIASALFVAVVSIGGSIFIAQDAPPGIAWQSPWIVVIVLSGLLLWTLPFNALLEGCNQVVEVNRFRLVQAVAASVAVWVVMVSGGGLWAAVGASAARLLVDWYLLLVWYRKFFRPFFRAPQGEQIQWRSEVWPLQWRLAVGAVLGYFAYFLFTPVMYKYQGAAVAGQMGMTWTVITSIQAAALAWVQTRAPQFGILVRRGDRQELDRVFFRVGGIGALAFVAAAGVFWVLLWGLNVSGHDAAQRLLDPTATAVFLVAALIQLGIASLAFYVRAHKQEPFLWVGIASNIAIGLLVWVLGARFGPLGAAAGLLGANLCLTFPTHVLLWQQCRAAQQRGGG